MHDEGRPWSQEPAVQVPHAAELPARVEWFTARLVTTSVQSVTATLARDDGTPVRTLYDGPVADSLAVKWDGLTAAGSLPDDGRYVLHVAPHPALDDGPRPLQVTLDITQVPPDTLPWPAPPTSPTLLPERTSASPAPGSLATGALAAAAVVALPARVGPPAEGPRARLPVAAA